MPEFRNPVRLVWGEDALARTPELLRAIGVTRPLLVTDRAILSAPAGQKLLAVLDDAGLRPDVFDGCEVDARSSHIQAETARLRQTGADGVIGLGGGSVLCTAKGIATLATNGDDARALETAEIARRPLPMILVPTTAGSGTEVSPFTIVRDDINGGKFTFGGPRCFADVALLDPLTLESLPPRLAAISAVDALSHAVEAYLSRKATPVSDALALQAAAMLAGSLHGSIAGGDPGARMDNLLGAALANMACGQARLGLAHRLSRPLEEAFGLPHGIGVGVLLPRVVEIAAEALPERADRLAAAMGASGGAAALPGTLLTLYARIGFPPALKLESVPQDRLRALAEAAVTRASDGEAPPERITGDTGIPAANGVGTTVARAEAIFADCRG